jgi:5-methylcytosine-specific restriction endonuclease McrA
MNHEYNIQPQLDLGSGHSPDDGGVLSRQAQSAPAGESVGCGGGQHGQLVADSSQPAGPVTEEPPQSTAHQLDLVCDQEHALAAERRPGGAQGQLGSVGEVTGSSDHAVCRGEQPKACLLRVNETVALFNGSSQGRVLSERQLMRHRAYANHSFVAGNRNRHTVRVDVLRYVAWLIDRRHAGVDDHPLDGEITYHGVYALLAQQEYRCALTGRHLVPEDASLDHVIPVSRQGPHRLENAQVLHKDVNRSKGALTNPEFIALCREVVAWADRSIFN